MKTLKRGQPIFTFLDNNILIGPDDFITMAIFTKLIKHKLSFNNHKD